VSRKKGAFVQKSFKLRALYCRRRLENLADLRDLGALEACAAAADDEAFVAPVDALEVCAAAVEDEAFPAPSDALEVAAAAVEAGELAALEVAAADVLAAELEVLVALPGLPPLPPLVVEEAAALVEADAVLLAVPVGATLDVVPEAAVPVEVTLAETEAVPEAVAVVEVGALEEAGSSALGSTRLFPPVPGTGWPEAVTVN
jgi:hypothetical protein